jgi:AcrR family transcriptional regulator
VPKVLSSKLLPIRPSNRGAEERVTAILDATDELLKTTALEDFSLVLVARKAGIPNASIYHFFPSSEAVLAGLLRRYLAAMDVLVEAYLVAAPSMHWQKLVRHLFEIVRTFYAEHPVSATLVFHGGGFGGLQSVDDDHVEYMARLSTAAFEARFYMPMIEDVQRRVAIAIAMSDRIWAMDVHNGCVSDFMFEESQRAIISYLSNFLPPVLACREDAATMLPVE